MSQKEIYLAGGCFWGVQKYFDQFPGVLKTETGYANGPSGAPEKEVTYEKVCQNSGHAETVRVIYEDTVISLETLLEKYFLVIDPLSVNRQGHDTGIQYRTGVYFTDPADEDIIKKAFSREQAKYERPMAVEKSKLQNFYKAEEFHQKYLDKNPGGYCHIPAEMF